jgi:hypothetical protein
LSGPRYLVKSKVHRLRNNKVISSRTTDEWTRALLGHAKSAHGGEITASCVGCSDLYMKANEETWTTQKHFTIL